MLHFKKITGYKVWINDLLMPFVSLCYFTQTQFKLGTVLAQRYLLRSLRPKARQKCLRQDLRASLFFCNTGMLCCVVLIRYAFMYVKIIQITLQRSKIAKHDYILLRTSVASATIDQPGQFQNKALATVAKVYTKAFKNHKWLTDVAIPVDLYTEEGFARM